MSPELKEAVQNAHGGPVEIEDPQTQARYVLVKTDVYNRVKALFEEDFPSEDEQIHFLREAGKSAGWDDPEMDIYNDMK
jgi:hypothetical protein